MKAARKIEPVIFFTLLFVFWGADAQADGVELVDALEAKKSGRHLEFYASDKAAQFEYSRGSDVVSIPRGRINAGFLFNEKRDNVFSVGLALDARPKFLRNLTLSIGGKVYAGLLSIENADVFGISVGVESEYALQVDNFPLTIQGALYYAPDILSFGQSDRIFDWNIKAGLRVRESVFAFVGFRFLQFDTRPSNRKLDNGANIGIRWHMG